MYVNVINLGGNTKSVVFESSELYKNGSSQSVSFIYNGDEIVMDNIQFLQVQYSKDIKQLATFGFDYMYMPVTTKGYYIGTVQFTSNLIDIFGLITGFDNIERDVLLLDQIRIRYNYTDLNTTAGTITVKPSKIIDIESAMLSKPGFTLIPQQQHLTLVSYVIASNISEKYQK